MSGPSIDLMREETRNKILRRVDWRFLLANPYPVRSVCFTDGGLAQAVSAISDRMVSASSVGTNQCDLAVALNPDRSTLQRAWLALQPGGECYTEWYGPFTGGTGRITEKLQASGFEDIHCYWPWPWPQRTAAFWLPLDAPGLIAYFFAQRAQIGGRRRRVFFKLRETVWRFGAHSGLLRPICATARKPGAQERSHDIRAHWSGWSPSPAPERLHALLLTGGQHSLNKVVALVSPTPRHPPQLIVKQPRVPQASEGLRREAAILQQIQQRCPQVPGIPRLVFSGDNAAAFNLGETVLNGVPLYTRLQRTTFRTLALQATSWLVGLAAAPCPAQSAAHSIEMLRAELQELYGAKLNEAVWQKTMALLAPLGDLPVVCEQRDFSPWNVLIDQHGQWNVLDWEGAEIDGLPARDLIYFLTYLSFFVEGIMESKQYRAAYRRLLDPASFTGAVFAECQARYAEAIGLDHGSLKALRVLTWMLHARSEYQRHRAEIEARPETRQTRRGLFISLWQAELREKSSER